ncbi:MAG: hypothetical protein NZM16_06155 [Thermoflexus sp.]|uniref:hypothetical protein n=1 Tax=Thermoflexus sp. TaxID=1969742 RepID=UPI0025CF857C|nr:hypothetical protein [Thermoflexus sp.]MCS6963610.1 hypothetical protein [Thermoflexus sp.]
MAFTVRDFESLIRLLDRRPEWREALRQRILTRELLELPVQIQALRAETERRFQRVEEQIAALAEAQRRHYEEFAAYRAETERRFAELRAETDRRFAELAEAQRRTEERVGRLEEAVAALAEAQRRHYEEFAAYRAETDRRFAELAEALRQLTERVDQLMGRVDRLDRRAEDHARDLSRLKPLHLEFRLQQRPADFFRPLIRRAAVISMTPILDDAVAAGRLREEEAEDAARLDLLVEGFHRREDRKVYLAVEISWLGDTEDIERVVRRAALFARALEAEVWPVVAAEDLTGPARIMARRMGVWWVGEEKTFRPEEIPLPPSPSPDP